MPSVQQYLYYGMIIVLIVLFYVLLIRPQKKREKADQAMRNSIMTGDRICTIGGIIGRVVAVTEETITIETTNNRTRLKMYKWAIRSKIEKEDLANDSKVKKESKEGEDSEEK
ncbi:MAG: preprotein translocase subunit YajC [Eubacteriales bacterium]|nr:preprotein translocase subunit YajC [Eubacteriales bacterium]